jgi:hypothetical protein
MTDLRLETEMFDEIGFCPFCGSPLARDTLIQEPAKRCYKNPFHFLVIQGEETQVK